MKEKLVQLILLTMATYSILETIEEPRTRAKNKHRDRFMMLNIFMNYDDKTFRRKFRMEKQEFRELVEILRVRLTSNSTKAQNSSGNAIPAEMKVLIALRMLAGASYLDLIDCGIAIGHIHNITMDFCKAINQELDNLHFQKEHDLQQFNQQWNRKQLLRYGTILIPNIVMAGDGVVFEIKEPPVNANIFRNRKQLYGISCQAFCDANCRFSIFEARWPGSTNDITAYCQTKLYELMGNGGMGDAVLLLDNIYTSCGGNHLTPFSGSELMKEKERNPELYWKMVSFNKVLCGMRITIERAFGQLVQRWRLIGRRIDFDLKNVPIILLACARLHNFCVDHWVMKHPNLDPVDIVLDFGDDEDGGEGGNPVVHMQENPEFDMIIAPRRRQIMEDIYNKGYQYEGG